MMQESSISTHRFALIQQLALKHLFGWEIVPGVVSLLEQINTHPLLPGVCQCGFAREAEPIGETHTSKKSKI